VSAAVALALILVVGGGLLTSGGDPGRMFGADWSQVNWADVGTMLLVVLVLGAVLVPLVWLALPRRLKGLGAAFTALAVLAPLGLIAPGFAYGEGSATDVKRAFGYVPKGLQDLSGVFSAPLAGYNVPLPFFSGADAPLWRTAIGYEVSGLLGILLLGVVMLGLATVLRRRTPAPPAPPARKVSEA
jgi:cobalt/nickel transport system permease protein